MRWLTTISQQLGHQQWFATVGRVAVVPMDRALYRISGGRWSLLATAGLPPLSLITIGRKSGQRRMVSLLYTRHGSGYIVTASNWGQQAHPAWSANLLATPEAEVNIKGRQFPVQARLVTGAERSELWSLIRETWPAYDTYAARAASREIRVFVLTPVAG